MISQSPWVLERFGPRGARLALLASGTVFMALISIWASVEVMAAWRAGHGLRAVSEGVIALLLLALSLRIMAVNWRATCAAQDRPVVLADGNEQSGVWGVGGPSMREPGSTGAWPMRGVDRRYEDQRD